MAETARAESRLFPILTTVALTLLVASMPARLKLIDIREIYGAEAILVLSMLAASFSGVGSVWHRIERWVTFIFVWSGVIIGVFILRVMIVDIVVHNRDLSAITLLTTSVSLWMANLLYFALFYWQLDRGGPDGRVLGSRHVDFAFTQDQQPNLSPGWRPAFPDYLFLGFTASTAFSPCDVLPLSVRGKMTMMLQSSISLVTVVIVAARAINVMQ